MCKKCWYVIESYYINPNASICSLHKSHKFDQLWQYFSINTHIMTLILYLLGWFGPFSYHLFGNFGTYIFPTDFHIFFRGVGTTNQTIIPCIQNHWNPRNKDHLVGGSKHVFFHILGMSSSQLTNSNLFQRGSKDQPDPTSHPLPVLPAAQGFPEGETGAEFFERIVQGLRDAARLGKAPVIHVEMGIKSPFLMGKPQENHRKMVVFHGILWWFTLW